MINNSFNNVVDFTGNSAAVLEVLAYFRELICEGGARLDMGGQAFSDIAFLHDGRISFQSSGTDGSEILQEIAEHFGAGFVQTFGSGSSYGEAVFTKSTLTFTVLDEDDLRLIGYDQVRQSYTVAEHNFEGQAQAMDHLLAEKRVLGQRNANSVSGTARRKR